MTRSTKYLITGLIGISIIIGTIFLSKINIQLDRLFDRSIFFRTSPGIYSIQLIFYAPLFYVLSHSKIAKQQLQYIVILFIVRAMSYLLFALPFMNGLAGIYGITTMFFDFAFVVVFIMLFNQQELSITSRALLLIYALLSVRSLLIFDGWELLIVWVRQLSFIIGMTILTYQVLDTEKPQSSEFL